MLENKDFIVWILYDSINDDEVFKDLNNLRNSLILVGIAAVVICIFIALVIGKYISKPIERLTGLIDVTTDLDLSNNSEYDNMLKFKDETGTMVRAIAKMRKVLRNIVCDLAGNSKEVFTYSKELMNSIGEASASIDEISKTVDQLAAGSVEQAESAQKGTNKLNIFAEKIEDVVASTKLMEQYSSETIMANQECLESINDLQNKFSENNNMIVEVGNNVDKLSNQSNQINDIVKTIGAIAEQTNLLALNAAIEAARAGEHGRGFSVVADEIRKLSEQTSNSTIEISKIVSDIDNGISLTKGTMDSAKVINDDTNEVLENTTMIFDKIDAILAKTVEQIEKVFENVQRIDTDKEEILSSIEEISSISQESAAATEEISSSITSESSVFENVLKTSQELEKLAGKLDSIVNEFNIR
ncbi:methyl-accepting chemotaxis protein [Haloimpatiens sp. FM7330]|uniref:methyl-accepting chemotaxis protein n=1 Tax=Haloimpatiens sp. FM7330 TaxID=3298610 RepID=UPI00362E89CF